MQYDLWWWYINVLCASQLTFRFLDYMCCLVFSGEIVLPWVAGRGASASGTGSDWSFAGGECTISAEADFTSLANAQAQAFRAKDHDTRHAKSIVPRCLSSLSGVQLLCNRHVCVLWQVDLR